MYYSSSISTTSLSVKNREKEEKARVGYAYWRNFQKITRGIKVGLIQKSTNSPDTLVKRRMEGVRLQG